MSECMHACVCMQPCLCKYVSACKNVHVSVCAHAYNLYMRGVYIHIYIYVLMCIHMFIRTTTHINLYQQMNSFLLTPTPLSGKLERRSVVETYLCSLP